jgi:hypothetical protein
MAISLSSIKKSTGIKAPRIMLYGPHGLGKTTFGASAPSPIFIQTEDGLGAIKTEHFPLATSFQDVLDAIGALYTDDHNFKTVVLDSADWLDNLIWIDINQKHDEKALAYGKGATIAADYWRTVLDGFGSLRDKKDMTVILIAHSEIKRFDSPEVEPYDRYQPKLQARSSALIQEWCDAVLFTNFKTIVKKDDVGFNKTVSRGITTGERLIYTSEKPAYLAKNRFDLPESLPLTWSDFATALTPQPTN